MLRVKVKDLKEGMINGEDVFDSGTFPLVNVDIEITAEIIRSLKSRNIPYIHVRVPKGFNSDKDIELYRIREDIDYNGRIYIKEDLGPSLQVTSGSSIIVNGSIAEGGCLGSRKGNISIKGSIHGTDKKPVHIIVSGDLIIQEGASIDFARIKANGNVNISADLVANSSITAKEEILLKGRVAASQLTSKTKIKVQTCGDEESKCVLKVNPSDELARNIVITHDIYPGTTIILNDSRLEIKEKIYSRAFYTENGRVVSIACSGV